MGELVAGHDFVDGRCVKPKCGEVCGRYWVDIMYYTQANVNELDIAHEGRATLHELAQIEAKKERQDAAVCHAFNWRHLLPPQKTEPAYDGC